MGWQQHTYGSLRALRIRDALKAVIFGSIAGNTVAFWLTVEHFGGFGAATDADISDYPVAPFLWAIAVTALVEYGYIFYLMSTRNLWIRDDFGMSFEVQDVVLGLLSWAVLIGASYVVFTFVLPALGYEVDDRVDAQFPEPFRRAAEIEVVFFILLVGFVVPIVEEILFRGIVLRSVEVRTNPAVGILVSSLLFAVAHVATFSSDDIPIFSFALVAGLLFSFVAVWSGRLTPGIIAHTLNNVFVSIAVTS